MYNIRRSSNSYVLQVALSNYVTCVFLGCIQTQYYHHSIEKKNSVKG